VRVAKTAVCTGICLACMAQGAALMASRIEIGAASVGQDRPGVPLKPLKPHQPLLSRQPLEPFQPALTTIRVAEGSGGRKLIFNETPVQHARRFATDLLPVPDLPGLPSGALEPLIVRHSGTHQLDPRLVRAVIQIESGYNHRARSNTGAMGLMQLMPGTAVELAVRDPYDADDNLRGGTAYLRQLIDAFHGSLEMALAAYNAGPGAVERHRGVPPYPETVEYVQRVLALYRGNALAVQDLTGRRPTPYVVRSATGRLLVTTSLAGIH
jgi:hypothetical protein